MRPVLTTLATLAVTAAAAAPALADPPMRVTNDTFSRSGEELLTCDDGPVLQDYTVTRRVTTFYDSSGTAIREVRHAVVRGVRYDEDRSREAPFSARLHRVADLRTGTVTITGVRSRLEIPGPDPMAAGRFVIVPATGEVRFEAGRTFADHDREVCAFFYG